ncbi:MAG: hypothetical protein ABI433_04385 [Burkholderiaceae bacterium]
MSRLILGIVGLPIATLMLAKLFNSDTLGWIFGLMLMFGVAMLPFAAIFYAGMKLNARIGRGRAASSATAAVSPLPFTVQFERDGVHASDDAPSRQITVPPSATIRTLLELAMGDAYLPGISGGKATWVVESSGAAFAPIAVCAQQWAEPAFVVPGNTRAATHFGGTAPSLKFRYRRQDDPDKVLTELVAFASATHRMPN